MKPYIHKNPILPNARVDYGESITDFSKLQPVPSHDASHIDLPVPGDFEWWYFDIVDAKTGCLLKMVLHLGTDTYRTRFFPRVALSIKTPQIKHSVSMNICYFENNNSSQNLNPNRNRSFNKHHNSLI